MKLHLNHHIKHYLKHLAESFSAGQGGGGTNVLFFNE